MRRTCQADYVNEEVLKRNRWLKNSEGSTRGEKEWRRRRSQRNSYSKASVSGFSYA